MGDWIPEAFHGEGWFGLDWGLWSNLISEGLGVIVGAVVLTWMLEVTRSKRSFRQWKPARKRATKEAHHLLEWAIYRHLFKVRDFTAAAELHLEAIRAYHSNGYDQPLNPPEELIEFASNFNIDQSKDSGSEEIKEWHDRAVFVFHPSDIETVYKFTEFTLQLGNETFVPFWALTEEGVIQSKHAVHFEKEQFEIYTTYGPNIEYKHNHVSTTNIEKAIVLAESQISMMKCYVARMRSHFLEDITTFAGDSASYFQSRYKVDSHSIGMVTIRNSTEFKTRKSIRSSSYTHPTLYPNIESHISTFDRLIKDFKKEIRRLKRDFKMSADSGTLTAEANYGRPEKRVHRPQSQAINIF